MLRYIYSVLIAFFFIISNSCFALESEWSDNNEAKVRIISPNSHNNNEALITLGLEYKLLEGWKTYWKSPGDGGFPQELEINQSKNVNDVKILWPIPKEFEILGFISIGYENEVIFPIKVFINDIKKETFLSLKLNYLFCREVCIPGNADLQLTIPPGKGETTKHFYSIEKSLSLVPEKNSTLSNIENFSVTAHKNNDSVILKVLASNKERFSTTKFFIDTNLGLPIVKPKIIYSSDKKKIEASFLFNEKNFPKDHFDINVILKDNNSSFEFSEKVNIKQSSKKDNDFKFISIIYILIISLIGGLILNVMPCVLPVLSLKILSMLKNSNENNSVRNSFLLTSSGIISSFAILAIILIILKEIGLSVGWGIQFQQPIFLIFISIILFLFSLNMFGFYEFRIPAFINSKITKRINKESKYLDFFNGFFATLLATPCSAPFVGTAITVAFTQSAILMLSIFIFMGIGMASPYILISFFPQLINVLPKPGKWMIHIKYFLGLLLFGTFIWIIMILLNHFDFKADFSIQDKNNDWENISDVNIEKLVESGNNVFVDITADWCATCQFNKINVLNSKEIKNFFEENKVIKVRGDWTKSNKLIENFLISNNKYGIPFNIIYSPDHQDGIIFSEILNKKEILNSLKTE